MKKINTIYKKNYEGIDHCIEHKPFMRLFINNDAYIVECIEHPVYGYECWLTWRTSFTNKF